MVDAHGNPTGHVLIGKQKSVTLTDVIELIKANNTILLKSMRAETALKTQLPAKPEPENPIALTVKPESSEQPIIKKEPTKLVFPKPRSSEDEFLELISTTDMATKETGG
jgi:hypothetical protein